MSSDQESIALERTTRSQPRVLGVLGGMGPAATVDFLDKLIKATPARRDQDHIPAVIGSFPQIPDRTAAILRSGPSPLPALLEALRLLEGCGVSAIVIPCSTAHHWFDELQSRTKIPMIHMVDAVIESLRRHAPAAATVGLLATTATIHVGVYARRLRQVGIECIAPDETDQARIMEAIRAVKAGQLRDAAHMRSVQEIADRLFQQGAASVVLGCTELPILLQQPAGGLLLDATDALARSCAERLIVHSLSSQGKGVHGTEMA